MIKIPFVLLNEDKCTLPIHIKVWLNVYLSISKCTKYGSVSVCRIYLHIDVA